MPATLTTVNAITKEVYQGRIVDQLQNEIVGFKRIEQTSEGVTSEVGGKYVTFPVRVKRNAGIGYRNENEALMASGQQGYASVRVGLKYGYGRVNLSGPTMSLAKTNFQAFANAMDMEMTGLTNDIKKDVNRIFYGDGTGTLAVEASDTANTVTVVDGTLLEVGQVIDILSSNGVTVRASARNITAITYGVFPAATLTYDGADVSASTVATDIVVRTGNYGREPNGLKSIVAATGQLFNIDPATVPQWAATINGNAGSQRPLSEGLMIKVTDDVRRQGGKTSLILTSLGVRRAYFNLLSQQRRVTNTTNFPGGLTGLTFSNGRDIPVVEDVDHPNFTMNFLEEDAFKIYRESPWDWLQMDGDIWKWVSGFDAWEAVLHQYWEIGINRRNANGQLQDITEG